MIESIASARLHAVTLGATPPGGGASVTATMATLSARIAGSIAGALGRAPSHPAERYDIGRAADALAAALGAGPADAGRIARSLDGFASEVAALVAARPDSATVSAIGALLSAEAGNASGVDAAIGAIEGVTEKLRNGAIG